MTITKALTTVVSTLPYLHDENDVQAVIQGIKNLQAALSNVQNLTWTYPSANTTVEDFVNDVKHTTTCLKDYQANDLRCLFRTPTGAQTIGLVSSCRSSIAPATSLIIFRNQ